MSIQECFECESGIRFIANGEDDSEAVYCDCKAGEKLAFLAWFKDAKKGLVAKMSV